MKVHGLPGISQLKMRRAEDEELLDHGLGSEQDVAQNLAEMQRINDWLGGTRALTCHLMPCLENSRQPITLLDLGTGGAGLPRLLARWARRKGIGLRILAVDWSTRSMAAAAQTPGFFPEIQLVRADALCLPVSAGQVDYVISSLFLHHLTPRGLTQMLGEAYRLARCGVIMSDLVRGWLPYMAFALIQPVFARNYLTRHDGALSVRRAYSTGELRELAEQAGLTQARIYTHFPWRMTLVVEK